MVRYCNGNSRGCSFEHISQGSPSADELPFPFPAGARFSAEKPRRLQRATGMLPSAAFRIHQNKKTQPNGISRSAVFGGGWWIRTTEGVASRFTVCPLWPLGKSPIFDLELVDGFAFLRESHGGCNMPPACCQVPPFESGDSFYKTWSWWTDSNPRPADYKSAALPAELHQHTTSRDYINRCFFVCQ